jgi:hypothetical protein
MRPILIAITISFLITCQAQPHRFADYVESDITSMADVPPPVGPDVQDAWHQTDALIATYWSSGDGFDGKEGKEYTYGEVTGIGARQLAHEMGISSTEETEGEGNIKFYDLGSGVARLVVQMVLDNPVAINKSVGVELSKERHDIAASALSRIRSSDYSSELLSKVELANADALKYNFSDATHIFISSLCFPRQVLEGMQDIILDLGDIRVVAALNRLDKLELSSEWEVRDASLQMTWGAYGSAKIYRKYSTQKVKR